MSHKNRNKKRHTDCDLLFRYAEYLNFGEVHVKFDLETGLRAIVSIHNLKRGPAIGGCRLVHYPNTNAAIEDSMRLAHMMSYKAAISNLPHGGAKAVVMKPKVIKDRKRFFEVFGDFVHSLGGKYITAVDSGTSNEDMDIVAKRTPYVTCTTLSGNSGDPSPQTAFGVRRAIEAAVKFKLNRNDLSGLHVSIQGVGHVGYLLAKDLHERGAKLTICDVSQKLVERCRDEFSAQVVSSEDIYDVQADVFAPCALGAVLNLHTINRLRVPIIAGSANNQLAHQRHGKLLLEKGILYAPDFVINAGGLIHVASIYDHADPARAHEQVAQIYETSLEIFERSQKENIATNAIAEKIARERLK